MSAAALDIPRRRVRDRQRAASDPATFGLGVGQRRLGQDPCADPARAAAAARRASPPRASSASPSPRRRRPTWRRASSRRLSAWTGLDDDDADRDDRRDRRAASRRPPSSPSPEAVRARHRDAGRTEDPDASTPSASACCICSRSRPMSPRASASLDEREADVLMAKRARGAFARRRSPSPSSRRRSSARARRRRRGFRGAARRGAGDAAPKSRRIGGAEAYAAACGARSASARRDASRDDPSEMLERRRPARWRIGRKSSTRAALKTTSSRASLRRAIAAGDDAASVAAYLEAFFTQDGRAARRKPRLHQGRRQAPSRPPRALSHEQARLDRAARPPARRRGARAQPSRSTRRRRRRSGVTPSSRTRAAGSISTTSSSARGRCSNRPTRPGCSTSSTAASSISWSTKRRTPRARNGRSCVKLARGIPVRRRRARRGAHVLRGRRREAVDLLVPGRGAGACSTQMRRKFERRHTRPALPFVSVQLAPVVPLRAARSSPAVDRVFAAETAWRGRQRGRAEGAAAASALSRRPARPVELWPPIAAAKTRRAARTGACRSTQPGRATRRSPLADRIADGRQGWLVAGVAASGSSTSRPARRAASPPATSSSWCARAAPSTRR